MSFDYSAGTSLEKPSQTAIRWREEITLHFLCVIEETIEHAQEMAEQEDRFLHLYAKTLADDIHGAYEEGLLYTGSMHPKEVDEAFAMQEETVLARSKQRCGGLIDDVIDEMHWWACFEPEPKKNQNETDRSISDTGRTTRFGRLCVRTPQNRSQRTLSLWEWEKV